MQKKRTHQFKKSKDFYPLQTFDQLKSIYRISFAFFAVNKNMTKQIL